MTLSVLSAQLRSCPFFTLLLHFQASGPVPTSLKIILNVELESPESLDFQFYFVVILKGAQASVVSTSGYYVSWL